jgi:hypothetical protein
VSPDDALRNLAVLLFVDDFRGQTAGIGQDCDTNGESDDEGHRQSAPRKM